MALEFCCHLSSLQQIAFFAGCKTTTSAAIVHCLRQKTEDELLETSLKMVSASILRPYKPPPCELGPRSHHPSCPWSRVSPPSQDQVSLWIWMENLFVFLLYHEVSQTLAKSKNNIRSKLCNNPSFTKTYYFAIPIFRHIFKKLSTTYSQR